MIHRIAAIAAQHIVLDARVELANLRVAQTAFEHSRTRVAVRIDARQQTRHAVRVAKLAGIEPGRTKLAGSIDEGGTGFVANRDTLRGLVE